jgi:hypothetical protein
MDVDLASILKLLIKELVLYDHAYECDVILLLYDARNSSNGKWSTFTPGVGEQP